MKVRIAMFAVLCALIVPAAARATITTSAVVQQYAGAGWNKPTNTGYVGGFVTVVATYEESSTDASITPSTTLSASGVTWDCNPSCTNVGYALQPIDPTSFTMDPVGNSARMQFTLTAPSSPPLTVDLSMTRPTQLAVGPSNTMPNAWVDPSNGEAEASLTFAGVFLQRQGYRLTGVVNGDALTPSYWTTAYAGTNIYAQSLAVHLL